MTEEVELAPASASSSTSQSISVTDEVIAITVCAGNLVPANLAPENVSLSFFLYKL